MFSLQLSLVSVADNSHFCLFHINPYAKHKIRFDLNHMSIKMNAFSYLHGKTSHVSLSEVYTSIYGVISQLPPQLVHVSPKYNFRRQGK